MATCAEIAWNKRRALIDLAQAELRNAANQVVLRAAGEGGWRILDRSPVSARLARGDGAICRFELANDGLVAEIVGGSWAGRDVKVLKLDAEVRDGDVAAQN